MSVFRFKKFDVNQEKCPMKINTDGVLLGALADVGAAKRVCDIGTGTGVIVMMLAQRNPNALIDAVEIDFDAFLVASKNFENSKFNKQLKCYHAGFEDYFKTDISFKYDLIVSNPPYFLNSQESPSKGKNLARHTNVKFFQNLLLLTSQNLNDDGILQMVVSLETSELIQKFANNSGLYIKECIEMKSYANKNTFRHILKLTKSNTQEIVKSEFVIYKEEGVHSDQYINALKDFFIIF